jgi:hypothetical protein
MKVRLKLATMGRHPDVYEVVSRNADTTVLEDHTGAHFTAHTGSVEEIDAQPADEPEPAAPPKEPEPPVDRLEVAEDVEKEARSMYDDYCAAVGGTAFNGDPLPPSGEFFEDPTKNKQSNVWRAVAGLAIERITAAYEDAITEDAEKSSSEGDTGSSSSPNSSSDANLDDPDDIDPEL